MKKLSLALVAALSLSTAAFAEEAKPVSSSDGQIKFTGTITEAGCDLATSSMIISLGSRSVASITDRDSGWQAKDIVFNNCNYNVGEEGVKVGAIELTINPGVPADFSPKLWANSGGGAKGVGIEVEIGGEEKFEPIMPAGVEKPIKAKINEASNTATYQVRGRMVGAAKEVTAGSVETTISFVASYK